jgi:hypothetical protein
MPNSGEDPGFQVMGGGGDALKKNAPSGGSISCEKSRFYAKKIIFFPILGRAPGRPSGSAPAIKNMNIWNFPS